MVCTHVISYVLCRCDILSLSDIPDDTDFFAAGAASMDVVRLLSTVKQACGGVELENEAVCGGRHITDTQTHAQPAAQVYVRAYRDVWCAHTRTCARTQCIHMCV